MELSEETPYFDHTQFQRNCPKINCDGAILFHFASLGEPPVGEGQKVHIFSKCSNGECGFVDNYEPPVTEDEANHLREHWDGASYHPWNPRYEDPEEELEKVFGEEVSEELIDRLQHLGYY